MKEPRVEQLGLPKGYGDPKRTLEWTRVRGKLEQAKTYWVASVRPNGHPHVIPKDGVWLDTTWYYGGSPDTVHHRNLADNPFVSMHIGGETDAVIVEGEARKVVPSPDIAQRLADLSNVKYAHYGLENSSETYSGGVWALRPVRIVAWDLLYEDATRFRFD